MLEKLVEKLVARHDTMSLPAEERDDGKYIGLYNMGEGARPSRRHICLDTE